MGPRMAKEPIEEIDLEANPQDSLWANDLPESKDFNNS
jgi:hypothetical protein